MKKIVWLFVIVGGAVLARRVAPKMCAVDWKERFERMPDDFPPKWMFQNISAIREQGERILELLEEEHGQRAGAAPRGLHRIPGA